MRLFRHLVAFLPFALASLVFVPEASAAEAQALSQSPLTQESQPFHRGVNVLGYDPYWNAGGQRRFEWRHFTKIHKAGFDFVRVNLQAFRHMDASGRLEPQWLAKLGDVV